MKNTFTSKVSVIIDADPAKVWEALTIPEVIKKYFFGAAVISNWREGGPIVFRGEWEGKSFEDQGLILKIEPGKVFVYRYEDPVLVEQNQPRKQIIVTYRLNPMDDKTELTIISENVKDEETKEKYDKDWKEILVRLKKLLENEHVES